MAPCLRRRTFPREVLQATERTGGTFHSFVGQMQALQGGSKWPLRSRLALIPRGKGKPASVCIGAAGTPLPVARAVWSQARAWRTPEARKNHTPVGCGRSSGWGAVPALRCHRFKLAPRVSKRTTMNQIGWGLPNNACRPLPASAKGGDPRADRV